MVRKKVISGATTVDFLNQHVEHTCKSHLVHILSGSSRQQSRAFAFFFKRLFVAMVSKLFWVTGSYFQIGARSCRKNYNLTSGVGIEIHLLLY